MFYNVAHSATHLVRAALNMHIVTNGRARFYVDVNFDNYDTKVLKNFIRNILVMKKQLSGYFDLL